MKSYSRTRHVRRGSILVLSLFLFMFLMVLIACALDLGYIMVVRNEAQRSADAAALAAGWEYVSDAKLRNELNVAYAAARARAQTYASFNKVRDESPTVYANGQNSLNGDIVLGRIENPHDPAEEISTTDPSRFNAVNVRVRRTSDRGSAVGFLFARALGHQIFDVTTEAIALADSRIVGFRINGNKGNSGLMPFVVHVDAWHDLLNGNGVDNWSYDHATGDITANWDGIHELNMFPGAGNNNNGNGNGSNPGHSQITAGNWGTVDIGTSGNSTSHLRSLILDGPSQQDLAYHGGQIALDPVTGTLQLTGDTGISAGMSSAIAQVVGQPRSIFLYNHVSGNGNNTVYTIVGFVGIRIVTYQLTGSNKYITIQPAFSVDPTAISGNYANESYFVVQPVRLIR